MEIAKVTVSGADAVATYCGTISAGMVGVQVAFTYEDPLWDDLSKTVVFRNGKLTRDVLNAGEIVTIPGEMTARPNRRLEVGVYGVNADGAIIIPTVWASLGVVQDSANPSGDPSTDPTLPVWAQLDKRVTELEKNGTGSGGDSIIVDADGYLTTASGGFTVDADGYVLL